MCRSDPSIDGDESVSTESLELPKFGDKQISRFARNDNVLNNHQKFNSQLSD
jgi:hypothetical protein